MSVEVGGETGSSTVTAADRLAFFAQNGHWGTDSEIIKWKAQIYAAAVAAKKAGAAKRKHKTGAQVLTNANTSTSGASTGGSALNLNVGNGGGGLMDSSLMIVGVIAIIIAIARR